MSESDFLFVIPLGICFVATCIATRFSDDLTYLGMAIAIASGLFSLVLAPWEIQLLLLGLVLFGAKKIQSQLACQDRLENPKTDTPQDSNSLHLEPQKTQKTIWKYRGISYEMSIEDEPEIGKEVSGIYRGKPWKSQDRNSPVGEIVSHSDLKYRGLPWTPQSDIQIDRPIKR